MSEKEALFPATTNPFKAEAKAETPAGDSADTTTTTTTKEIPAAAEEPTRKEVLNSDLFSADGEGGAAESDNGPDPSEPIFDRPDDKGRPRMIPKARFDEVISERNELRKKAKTVEEKAAEATEILQGFLDSYGAFDNPVAQAAYDAQFMSALEEQAKTDPAAAAVAQKILANQAKLDPNAPREERPNVSEDKKTESAPKTDPLLPAVLRGQAARTIQESLDDIQPAFRALVADKILAGDPADLAALTPADVRAAAREFFKDKGFTAETVLTKEALAAAEPADDDDGDSDSNAANTKAGAKPPGTSGGKSKADTTPTKSSKAAEDKAKDDNKPKSREEWQAARDARLANAAADLGLA